MTRVAGGGGLTDARWARLEPLLPVGNGRCGRWRDCRQVIDGVLYRVRTGGVRVVASPPRST
ncbi:transposase [Kitasatospora sp. NPDC057223]|uniref:transposase n=1 Tax=Kitasatospora sp. NPDC057223 TaxID=3346055 RepID=UPI00363A0C46